VNAPRSARHYSDQVARFQRQASVGHLDTEVTEGLRLYGYLVEDAARREETGRQAPQVARNKARSIAVRAAQLTRTLRRSARTEAV